MAYGEWSWKTHETWLIILTSIVWVVHAPLHDICLSQCIQILKIPSTPSFCPLFCLISF